MGSNSKIKKEAAAFKHKFSKQEADNKEISRANKRLTRQNADLLKNYEKQSIENVNLKADYETLRENAREVMKRAETAKSDLEKERLQYKGALAQIESFNERKRVSDVEISRLQSQLKELELSNTQWKVDNDRLQSKLDETLDQNAALERRDQELSGKSRLSETMTESRSESDEQLRLTESALSNHDKHHDTFLHQSINAGDALKPSDAADEDFDANAICTTSIQRITDAADLKTASTSTALNRTTSASAMPRPSSFNWDTQGRRDELAKRNQSTKPHLQSSYPMEMD